MLRENQTLSAQSNNKVLRVCTLMHKIFAINLLNFNPMCYNAPLNLWLSQKHGAINLLLHDSEIHLDNYNINYIGMIENLIMVAVFFYIIIHCSLIYTPCENLVLKTHCGEALNSLSKNSLLVQT